MADERGQLPAEPAYSSDEDMADKLTDLFNGGKDDPGEEAEDDRDDSGDDLAPESGQDEDGDAEDDDAKNDEEPEDSADNDEDTEDDAAPSDDPLELADEVEFESNGKKYNVPKALVEGAMRREKFVEAMRETSEHRSYIASQAESLRIDVEFQKQVAPLELQAQNLAQQIDGLSAQLPQYAQMGDKDGYVQVNQLIQSLQAEYRQAMAAAEGRKTELRAAKEKSLQSIIEAGNRVLSRSIPDWGKDVFDGILAHAQAQGYTPEELRNAVDPRFIKLAYDSMRLERMQGRAENTREKVKRVAKAAPVVRPGSSASRQTQASQAERIVKHARKTGNPADAERALMALMRGPGKR